MYPYDWQGATMLRMLENPVYLGHTYGQRFTTISYKNKTEIKRPECEQVLVKNTHPAIISQELWNIVQSVRQHKHRPPKHMTEPNLFSGLIYCADCGKNLTYGGPSSPHFRCSTYRKRGRDACTLHQIREAYLKKIVLDDLRRVTHFARMKERQFAEHINRKNSAELKRAISKLQKELDAMKKTKR